MKVGLIASGYNCEQFLAECVAGWRQFKAHGEHELVVALFITVLKRIKSLGSVGGQAIIRWICLTLTLVRVF